jgi:hypothetical protein
MLASLSVPAGAADRLFTIKSAEETSSISFGFFAQAQAEFLRGNNGAGNSQDLYLRRFRLITSGQITDKLSFFVETDSPNLGKGTGTGTKVEDRIYLQDVVLTYTMMPQFQIDAGMLLVTSSHNSGQGATSLLPVDYGPFTFVTSDPLTSRVGRDYGLQARGYVAHNHFEYRVGVFQGLRSPNTSNPFRVAGRFVWYPFQADTGFFYTGTTFGAKRILAIGGGFDHQKDFTSASVDAFLDQPVPSGSVTFQAGYTHLDGGILLPQLPKERVWLLESGYYNRQTRLGPFAQISGRLFSDQVRSDLAKYQGGVAYWAAGHKYNVKLGIGKTDMPKPDSWQVVLQAQVFLY